MKFLKAILAYTFFYLIRFSLWFRYSVTIKGLDKINPDVLNKSGGTIFLPNHPTVFVDPILITLAIWKKYPVRPMIVEYMYYTPIIHQMMQFMNAIPIPNFVSTSNSLKKRKSEKVFETVIDSLHKGDSFLIYPAGKVKHQAKEIIGASGVHKILQAVPETNVVLVRISGLWGSSFSRALTNKTPNIFSTILNGLKIALKNLIFFTPRRQVTIELEPAGPDFPFQGTRMEINRYLEDWYNRPDGLSETTEKDPGESLYLVSYSMWKKELPKIDFQTTQDFKLDIAKVPLEIQKKINEKLNELSQLPIEQIKPEMDLGTDLGLDSLDIAELLAFLDDNYEITGVPVSELTSVGKLMAIASKQVVFDQEIEELKKVSAKWNKPIKKIARATVAEGKTIPEVFLNKCAEKGNEIACGDDRTGILTFAQTKMRVLLLAEYIRNLPGEYIGILLPSSVGAYLTILACQLAGKIPLLINWTVGPRHLETVTSLSHVQVILSSWAFLDRLENAVLTGIEDKIVMFEDLRRTDFTLKQKIKAFYRSKLSTQSILKIFNIQDLSSEARAVLLFTSGTESMPKGVPLTHENILSNQRGVLNGVELRTNDVLVSMLPPFHAFGFTVTGLLPLLSGIRAIYYPDPTDGKGLARTIEHWNASVVIGTPTFLKGMFKGAKAGQLKTLRLCATGAEKAPPELFKTAKQLPYCAVVEGYGITECSPVLTFNDLGDPSKGVGKAIPGVEMRVVDLNTHIPLEIGKVGLILVRGPGVFNGYLNKGLSSPFILVNDEPWYSTGDLGFIDPEGNLTISGRLKRFVKVGGEMISLAALEEALLQIMGQKIRDLQEEGPVLAVCAKEISGEKPKFYLFARFAMTVDEANKAFRESGFSNLVKISDVIQVKEIPIMGSGKTNYRALENQMPVTNNHSDLMKATT